MHWTKNAFSFSPEETELCQGDFKVDNRRNLSTRKVVKHWNRQRGGWWLVVCQCSTSISTTALITCFNFWLALKCFGSFTRWCLKVPSNWTVLILSYRILYYETNMAVLCKRFSFLILQNASVAGETFLPLMKIFHVEEKKGLVSTLLGHFTNRMRSFFKTSGNFTRKC